MPMPSALEIARRATLKPIGEMAEAIGITPWLVEPYGEHVAKIRLDAIGTLAERPRARYVVVTAVTPTPLGEGKTTTTIGLGQAMRHIGRRATITIRQASMGPTFGIKGGAAGGGYSQAVPFESLNLHLTGDMHAVTAAHNQLAAMVDNHLYGGNTLGLDPHSISWRRVVDVNDPPPADAVRVQAERVAAVQMVVDHRGQLVVRRGHRVHVPGQVQVQRLERHRLAVAAARGAALDPERRPHRRLPDRDCRPPADVPHRLAEPDRGGGLPLAERRRRDGRHHDVARPRPLRERPDRIEPDLGDMLAVGLDQPRCYADGLGHLADRLQRCPPGDLERAGHRHLRLLGVLLVP